MVVKEVPLTPEMTGACVAALMLSTEEESTVLVQGQGVQGLLAVTMVPAASTAPG